MEFPINNIPIMSESLSLNLKTESQVRLQVPGRLEFLQMKY